MPADSAARRLAKRALAPLLGDATYGWAHALSIVRDMRAGRYREPEFELVPLALRQGETALDLGANLGMYVPALSAAVGPGGRVYAFEPIPYTASTLRKVLKLLRVHNVELAEKGVGERDEPVTFQVPVQDSGALSTGQAYVGRRDDDHLGKEQQVRWSGTTSVRAELVALDGYLKGAHDVALIKADIEGAELPAFRGAAKLIERDRPTVICEINPWFLEGFGFAVSELISFFSDRSYALYHYEDDKPVLRRIRSPDEVVEDNYVFVHPSRACRLSELLEDEDPEATAAT